MFGNVWIVVLALVAGGIVFGWVAFFRVMAVERELRAIREQLASLTPSPSQTMDDDLPASSVNDYTREESSPGDLPLPGNEPPPMPEIPSPPPEPAAIPPALAVAAKSPARAQGQWMIWLGGICVGLAGIFMVRYGIEQGLLGPAARIALAIAAGLALHGAAEWLRRSRSSHPAFAALAGGASITLYAALLAALHLYHLLDARLVFALLAAVSLATMALALWHGPVLAAIGILGGYVVPLLVSTGSGNVVAAMVYALILTAAALCLLRYVFRPWLWWGLMTGVLGWWLISMNSPRAEDFRGIYLAIAAYMILATPRFDWLLKAGAPAVPGESAAGSAALRLKPVYRSLAALILAWGVSLEAVGIAGLHFLQWAPLALAIGLAARANPLLRSLPWISLAAMVAAIAISRLDGSGLDHRFALVPATGDEARTLLAFALQMAALYTWLGIFALKTRAFSHAWASMACLAPLVWLALAYVLTRDVLTGDLSGSWQWSLATLAFGAAYATLSGYRLQKFPASEALIWLILGSHIAYSLAAAMYFREAGLTLALAAQLVTLGWLARRYNLPWLGWLVKGVLALVVARLTLNPWLATYPADIHWSLWTYGGSTLCCFLASKTVAENHPLRGWLEAAAIHLLVLTLGAEVRYWLYDGDIFVPEYSLQESAINTSLWAALGLSYHYRAGFSHNLERLYRVASALLLGLALASYALSVTVLNPLWNSSADISGRPLFNLLLLAYGLPVILALLVQRLYPLRAARKLAGIIAAAGLLLFVSLEIRHLWQGRVDIHLATGNGELYTYSIVWLVMAAAAIVAGTWWQRQHLNRGGFLLLAVVIAKIFLVDMSGLEGLLRVASFMGLGFGLLGLAYLRSRIRPAPALHPEG